MRISTLTILCLKARIVSWLTTSEISVYVTTNQMSQIAVATFINGRYKKQSIPDTVPPDWSGQQSAGGSD